MISQRNSGQTQKHKKNNTEIFTTDIYSSAPPNVWKQYVHNCDSPGNKTTDLQEERLDLQAPCCEAKAVNTATRAVALLDVQFESDGWFLQTDGNTLQICDTKNSCFHQRA